MVCEGCGYEHPVYNSCLDRHCPKCQNIAQQTWISARSKRMLPVQHFHVVFTLPSELRSLARYRPYHVYNAFIAAAGATLLDLGRTKYNATVGITMLLHSWTRTMLLHPHVHAIVTAGGLSLDGTCWRPSNPRYLFAVKAMGALLRGKMMAALRALYAEGSFDGFIPFHDPQAFDKLMAHLASLNWIAYAKRPFRKVDHVLAYLGRYTHRVAISNSRLLEVTDDVVTFTTRNGKTCTISPVEFVHRFAQHVLPPNFHKIRHFGLYASACARPDGNAHKARSLLTADSVNDDAPTGQAPPGSSEQLPALTTPDVWVCPYCAGLMYPHPFPRAPPALLGP
jgi:hypothetical protein